MLTILGALLPYDFQSKIERSSGCPRSYLATQLAVRRVMLSDAERRYFLDGLAQGARVDGRGFWDARPVNVARGVLGTANGSAKVYWGDSVLLAGVKVQVVEPDLENPAEGRISAQVTNSQGEVEERLTLLINQLCLPAMDKRPLCIKEGAFVFEVAVDVLIIVSAGNLVDATAFAIRAALQDTVLPEVSVLEGVEEDEKFQLVVDDNPLAGACFPSTSVPVVITFGQIGGRFLVDMSQEEELCQDCVVGMAVLGEKVVGVRSWGQTPLDVGVLPELMVWAVKTASAVEQRLGREKS
jgi:exosome complex component RRP42